MKLTNKAIIITGASDGIGKEIALRLAKEKTKIAIIARDEKKLKEVSGEAKNLGAIDARFYPCDIRSTNNLEITVKSIIKDFGQIDILINNAGIWQKISKPEEVPSDDIDAIIQTNLTALIHLTNLLIPELKKSAEAAIINVISKSGVTAQKGQSVYTASKYGADTPRAKARGFFLPVCFVVLECIS